MQQSGTSESIKALVSVANKRQTHTGLLGATGLCLATQLSRVVLLRNLVNWEILSVDCGLQLGLKGSANASELVPLNATEEGVILEFPGAV